MAVLETQSWIRIGSSIAVDLAEAIDEAFHGLDLHHNPKLLVVLASPERDLAGIGQALETRCPGAAVIGCSTAGEIITGGAIDRGLVLWALGGTGIRVSTGWADSKESNLRQAAQQAASCLNNLERHDNTVLLLLSDGLSGDQMEVVRGAYDVANIDVPLVGGCAGDYLAMQQTTQLHGHQVMSGAVVAAAITSERPMGIGVCHGWEPVSDPMLVTESHGTELITLDDQPALDVFLNFFNPPEQVRTNAQAFADFAATHPIGIRRRDRIEMRHITGFDLNRRSLQMVAEVPQGALSFLSNGDYSSVLDAAIESAETAVSALGEEPGIGLLLFDCVSRKSIFGDKQLQEETSLISRQCQGIPMAGFYTYGEIARTHGSGGFHNQTLVTLAFA
jgi:hypothetical protein